MIVDKFLIPQYIIKGITSGLYPSWEVSFIDINKTLLSQTSLQYITEMISNEYIFGDVVEDEHTGYWQLNIG